MILIDPTLLTNDQEEHIYQELNQTNHEMTPLPTNTIPRLSSKNIEFRHLKQLLTDMEGTTSSWANAINQCCYVLQRTQDQTNQS
ncbi:unnamed protein product [Rotaria socialis]|uniref:Uncharacterized protein n=1 Tax=Rotaria socialis TaxID=392032 RepID=A0A817WBY8_9BILA|nr:unnamed protein product [Rotaria socialis]